MGGLAGGVGSLHPANGKRSRYAVQGDRAEGDRIEKTRRERWDGCSALSGEYGRAASNSCYHFPS